MLFANVFKRANAPNLNDDLVILSDEIRKLNARMSKFEAEMLELAVAQDVLRNKVLRKIQFKRSTEEEDSQNDPLTGIPYG